MAIRFNPRPFRWLALAGMTAVLGATLSSFLTSTRERPQPRSVPAPIAPQVSQQTQAFSLSKTSGDHTLYTVEADEVTHFDDKVVLRGVSILLYGKDGDRRDVIETEESEFDPNAKSLLIPGEVTMQLGIPPPDHSPARREESPDNGPDSVSIVTTGLEFDQATGVASTDQVVRFRFAQGQGTAQGARYDPESQQLILRSEVHFVLSEPGDSEATHVRTGSLRFQRGGSVVYLTEPVELTRASRVLRAGNSEILLDESRRVRRVRLDGGVTGSDRSDGRSAEARARRGLLELSESGRLSSLLLEEEVEWTSALSRPGSGPQRQGNAQTVQLFFNSPSGLLERVIAVRDVRIVLQDSSSELSPGRPSRSTTRSLGPGVQSLSSERVELTMAPDGAVLQRVSARPHSTLELAPFRSEEPRWRITGDEFQMSFDPSGNLARFAAEGKVQAIGELQSRPSDRWLSASDHLSATLDPRTRSVSRIEQSGHYRYQDADKQARAERAEYSAGGEITLLGKGSVWNPTGKLSADRIILSDSNGRIQAEENVSTTFFSAASPGIDPRNPVHAVADRLQYDSETETAQYQGRVRLWQGNNLLQANRVNLDLRKRQMDASGKVYSVIPQQVSVGASGPRSVPATASGQPGKGQPVEIRSARMLYRELERRVVYQGKTRMLSGFAAVNSEQLEVFLAPSTASTGEGETVRIDHAVASGEVVIRDSADPGREATAERAEYFPEEARFHLFGKPAVVWDSQRGSTQGVRLTYRMADDRIQVEGEPGIPAETRRQVRR